MALEQNNTILRSEDSRVGMWFVASTLIFILGWFVIGDIFGLEKNGRCFALLGCNAGFFGYDAFTHFLGGIMFAFFVVWLGKARPRFNVISANFWKNAVIVIAMCALLETGWEMWEFGTDHFRMDILHQDLMAANQLLQPTNADTMGDETFNLLGSIVAIALLASFEPNALSKRSD